MPTKTYQVRQSSVETVNKTVISTQPLLQWSACIEIFIIYLYLRDKDDTLTYRSAVYNKTRLQHVN